MWRKYKSKLEAKNFCIGQIWGQAKIWVQANFKAKNEAKPILRPSQARF